MANLVFADSASIMAGISSDIVPVMSKLSTFFLNNKIYSAEKDRNKGISKGFIILKK